jgi:hypothetical protein
MNMNDMPFFNNGVSLGGEQGNNGYSPTIKVEQTDTGVIIKITDINGTTAVNLTNGADGKDYILTESDKTNIATKVSSLIDLSGKQDKLTVIEATGDIVMENNTEYRYKTPIESVTIALPEVVDTDYISSIIFETTENTSFLYPNSISMTGDDVNEGVFIPVSGNIYNVIIFNTDIVISGVVKKL